ncbi:MAG: HPF/RaiA family ribosome-associated protein [Gemmatimonadales bacterium]
MQTTITVRHTNVPEDIKQRAEELVAKLANVAHRPQGAAVIFDSDHNKSIVEVKLVLARGQIHVAKAETDDFRSALDRAVEKMRHQLDKKTPSPVHR